MRFRRVVFSPDFVGALNLVEIELPGYLEVIAEWKKLLENYNAPLPSDKTVWNNPIES